MELLLGTNEQPTKVRIKGRAGTGDITVGVCYKATPLGRLSG